MSKETKQVDFSKEAEKEIKLIIREGIFDKVKDAATGIFGAKKTSKEKDAEDAEKAKEGESWLPIWRDLKEPYHSFFQLYMEFMEAHGMKLDTDRKTKIAELFRDRADATVSVIVKEMCGTSQEWFNKVVELAKVHDNYPLPAGCKSAGGASDVGPDGATDADGQGETTTTGGDGPVPIFKDMRVKDPETGKMRRVGAKDGGQGLQALLANWLAKNAPGEVNRKTLQQAAGRLVKAVAAQLKANDIAIQENQIIDYVKSMLIGMPANSKPIKERDEKPEDDDFRLTPPEDDSEPEPEVEAPPDWYYLLPGSSDQILDSFKKRIKKLDLDSTEGRYGASEPGNEQAYLGAYMLYKAMKNALEIDDSDVKYKQVMTYLFGRDWGTADSEGPARVHGGTQKLKEEEQQDLGLESELETWLRDMIRTFEREGLADSERASKASREARGVKEPKEKDSEPADAVAVAGTINTKQIVAPQLKSAGIDLKSPEGQKFAKNLEKIVRRFLNRHLQRLGKEDIKLIAENEEYMSRFVHIIQLYTEKLLKERKNGL